MLWFFSFYVFEHSKLFATKSCACSIKILKRVEIFSCKVIEIINGFDISYLPKKLEQNSNF